MAFERAWSPEIIKVHELSEQYSILEVIINDTKVDQSNRRKFWFLIDWSGSMYVRSRSNPINYSKVVERSLSKLLPLASDGGHLTRFSTCVYDHGDFPPTGERTLNGIRNDEMEYTNLPFALDEVTTRIAEFAKFNSDVLNILIFVSDGKYCLGKDVPIGDPTE